MNATIRTVNVGSMGASLGATAIQEDLAETFKAVAEYVVSSIEEGTITLNSEKTNNATFLSELSEQIVGSKEKWGVDSANTRRFGRESTGMMGNMVKDFQKTTPHRVKCFIEQQVSQGMLELGDIDQEAFVKKLVDISHLDLDM